MLSSCKINLFPHSFVARASLSGPTRVSSCTPCHPLLVFIFPACRFINHSHVPAVCFCFTEHHVDLQNDAVVSCKRAFCLNNTWLCVLVNWCDCTLVGKNTCPAGAPLDHAGHDYFCPLQHTCCKGDLPRFFQSTCSGPSGLNLQCLAHRPSGLMLTAVLLQSGGGENISCPSKKQNQDNESPNTDKCSRKSSCSVLEMIIRKLIVLTVCV